MTVPHSVHEPLDSSVYPLAGTLSAIRKHWPAALIDGSAVAALEEMGRLIPAALTRRMYFECRLRDGAPNVDLELCIDRVSRALLIAGHREWLPRDIRRHPLWSGLTRLCSAWAGERSIDESVRDLWLEFDIHDPPRIPVFVPSVFVGIGQRFHSATDAWAAGAACLDRLTGGLRGDVARSVRRCVAATPLGTSLLYAGVMYPRDEHAIRLCLSPVSGGALLRYIDAIGWPGKPDDVRDVLGRLDSGTGRTALDAVKLVHIDVREDVQPRLGLEIPLVQVPQLARGIREVRLLESVHRAGFCTAEKQRALVGWPGYSTTWHAHECWPSTKFRRVSHLKMVFSAGQAPELKAYLSLFHGPAGRSGDRRHLAAERISS